LRSETKGKGKGKKGGKHGDSYRGSNANDWNGAQQWSAPPGAPISMEIGGGQNSWAAKNRMLKMQAADDDAEILRKLKALLNKLTKDNFDRMYEQMTQAGITTASQVEMLMKEVFEKAVTQHFFIDLYTDLTLKLNEFIGENFDKSKIDFRMILIGHCQNFFDKYEEERINIAELNTEDEDHFNEQNKIKNKILGNLKFIGQLALKNLIAKNVVMIIAKALINKHSDFHWECFVKLLEQTLEGLV